ncbi:glutamyl-tRNA reductase [Paenibacillus terrigena]|uniref:glutamyl-tRNA reductase n=1 Tax=Paenibacillus terrigena TaxID=369333 RepID=UPI00037CB0B3|nr:glutamyl-tRNA reductase [Paenibacillus terrigena]
MHILAVGLNYRTAPVEVRERFAIAEQALPEALQQLKATKSVLECVIVATCNRTEIYVVVDRLHMCGHFIRSFMEKWFQIPRQEFTNYLYIYEDDRALEHLFQVTSGLDSMVIGETQILGQMKDAFLLAQEYGATGTWFNMLFKQAITMAKRAHAETTIGEAAVSVSYAAVELGKRIFGQFSKKKVLILGAGKMSELTVKHLYANGADEVIVANRTLTRAEQLASKFNGRACSIQGGISLLYEVDIVISSTGADGFVLDVKQVQESMKKRKNRPIFMIDIAVPRDLDPAIGSIPNVFLYDIDDLEGIVESNLELRRKEATKIDAMIAKEIEAFRQWLKTLGVSPVIYALQQKSAQIHQDTMESLFKKLPDLDERQAKVIRKLTKSIVNQMLHDPILRIKEMAVEKNGDEAIEMFTQIFALEEQMEKAEAEEQRQNKAHEQTSSPEMRMNERSSAGSKSGFAWATVTK